MTYCWCWGSPIPDSPSTGKKLWLGAPSADRKTSSQEIAAAEVSQVQGCMGPSLGWELPGSGMHMGPHPSYELQSTNGVPSYRGSWPHVHLMV